MLRMPAWRAEPQQITTPDFLDVCEAYELIWNAIAAFDKAGATEKVEEFRTLAEFLEGEALLIALHIH
ncbi:hypothetical protein [Bosea sp. BK604]|uniref:hypothetical protein n=1 Tax=Bosea sp. BK604 TaxID=2512180 RepID=UPI00104AF409|nr:hypothetical protein [Bosea sp. BK604]